MSSEPYAIPPKDRAFEGILWYIKHYDLQSGDRLPAERVLCEELGVSRTALRAAITRLISCGTLESRRGSGTYVCPPKPLNIFQETWNYYAGGARGLAQSRPRAWFGPPGSSYADIDACPKSPESTVGMPLCSAFGACVWSTVPRHRSRRLTSICLCAPRFPITILSRKASTTFCSRRGMSM